MTPTSGIRIIDFLRITSIGPATYFFLPVPVNRPAQLLSGA